jgi:hypothetical protein
MSDFFYHFGPFPNSICFEEKESIEQANEDVASLVYNYIGSYSGSLYPIRLSLQQAMDLFWRVRRIEVDEGCFLSTFGVDGEYLTTVTSPYASIYEFEATTSLDSLRKRVCGQPTFLGLPYKIDLYRTTGEIDFIIEDIFYILWYSEYFIDAIESAPKGVKIYKGDGDRENINNYWYYPAIRFVFADYGQFWTTFWPHVLNANDSVTSVDTEENIEITFNDFNNEDYSENIKLFRIINVDNRIFEGGSSSSGNTGEYKVPSFFKVELWPPRDE